MNAFLLNTARDALFLDIDGTLLDIAPSPEAVVVPRMLIDHLDRLHEKLDGALALVSGREIDNVDALFSPLRLPVSGVHGAEWRVGEERRQERPLPNAIRRAAREILSCYPELLVEDKKYSMAVHFRSCPAPMEEVERRLRGILPEGSAFSLLKGKMVCEIVYSDRNKGTAVKRLMERAPFAGRRPVFLGDDETDLFAVRECIALGGAAAQVGRGAEEHSFASPADVRAWLARQAA